MTEPATDEQLIVWKLKAENANLREALEVPRYWLRQLHEVSETCPDWSHCKMRVERADYDTFRAALDTGGDDG
jgi:hypothetical protein